jgi:AraC-like DNA-binding protein
MGDRGPLGGGRQNFLASMSDDIDLAMLADGVGLSKSHFCREFKETTGMPPHKWLVNARIEKAKEHLLAGHLALAEIALEVGFSDQSHFTSDLHQK